MAQVLAGCGGGGDRSSGLSPCGEWALGGLPSPAGAAPEASPGAGVGCPLQMSNW